MGGPGASGVLIAKKSIFYNKKAHRFGGGIVFFLNDFDHEYVTNAEELEESGTPAILCDIRGGLAFQLREALGNQTIKEKEDAINAKVLDRIYKMKNVVLLGNNNIPKVSIFSFLIKTKERRFLYPNIVVSLLNDLFGIQTRAGCACAAMFAHRLLGVDMKMSNELKAALLAGDEILRPGFTRLNINYFIDAEEMDYILDALEFVSLYGWMFLPHYNLEN